MSGLAEFLLARIADDEAVARDGAEQTYPGFEPWRLHNQVRHAFGQPSPVIASRARVLAECDAKRRIVEESTKEAWVIEQGHRTEWTEGGQAARGTVLRFLALPYADHPDYREEWRP